MMKHLSILLILAGSFIQSSYSQESSAYIKAGVNLANVSVTNDGNTDQAKMLVSFHAGIQGDLPVTSFLAIQPGLFFSGKGSKVQAGQPGSNGYYRSVVNPYYIELPANIVIKVPINKDGRFFFGAGPYVAMGIAGRRKLDYQVLGVAYHREDKITFSNDDPTTAGEEGAGMGILKRFDYGLNGTAGLEGKNVLLSINYGFGLAKLQSGSNNEENNNDKHRVLSMTIGFKL
jgi:hypothetical protein